MPGAGMLTGCEALGTWANRQWDNATEAVVSISDDPDALSYADFHSTGYEAACDVFNYAAEHFLDHVEISRDLKISDDDMRKAIETLRFTPLYLCSTGEFNYTVSSLIVGLDYYVTSLNLQYDYDKSLLPSYRSTLEQESQRISQELANTVADNTGATSEYDLVTACHDYLIENTEFDTTYQYFSAYDAIVDHRGTCQAYSQAFTLLLGNLGVNCDYADSDAMDHRWNMVEIEGNWYHVDVTWDDPIAIGEGTIDPINYRRYFLKSDDSMRALDHYDWSADHVAPKDWEG